MFQPGFSSTPSCVDPVVSNWSPQQLQNKRCWFAKWPARKRFRASGWRTLSSRQLPATCWMERKMYIFHFKLPRQWFKCYLSAAWQMVPQVSAISSTKMATRSLTSPTRTIAATSFAFFRSLWMRAKSTFKRSAIDVTLNCWMVNLNDKEMHQHERWERDYLLAPPASGETMMQLRHSGMFSLIHLRTAGSA